MFKQDELFIASLKDATIRDQQIRELQRTRKWLFVLMLVLVGIAYFYLSVPIYFVAAINGMMFMKVDQDIRFLLLIRALEEKQHDTKKSSTMEPNKIGEVNRRSAFQFIIFVIAAVAGIAGVVLFDTGKQPQRAKKFDDYFEKHFEKQYGALGKTTEEILGHENATNAFTVLGALHWRIGQKAEARGERSLTDTERRLLAAYWVEAEVNNGGFDQYFFNSAGDNAEAALAGLKDMGAAGAAALLERAMAVFPGSKPPPDRFKRQEVMEQIASQSKPIWNKCDDEFYKLTESISDLSLTYAKKKRAEIILP